MYGPQQCSEESLEPTYQTNEWTTRTCITILACAHQIQVWSAAQNWRTFVCTWLGAECLFLVHAVGFPRTAAMRPMHSGRA